MTTLRIDIPGIGGSLGECVLCGKPFILECLGVGNVQMMGMNGCDKTMPVHPNCFDGVKDVHDWKDLPEGPLKRAIAETPETEKEPTD